MIRNLKKSIVVLTQVLAVAMSLLGPGAVSARHAPAAEPDLAEMAITPDDFDFVGLSGWGIADGQILTAGALGSALDFERQLDTGTSAAVLDEAGFVAGYELRLQPAGDQGAVPTAAVRASTFRLADDDGAQHAFDFLANPTGGPYTEPFTDGVPLGDEYAIMRMEGTTDKPFRGVELTVKFGSLVLQIRLVNFTGDDPNIIKAERLGERALIRIDQMGGEQPSEARGQTLTLAEPAVVEHAYYTTVGGEPRRVIGQSDDDVAANVADIASIGLVDEFEVRQRVDDPLGAGSTWFIFATQQFGSDEQAANYLAATPERNDGSDGVEGFRIIDDAAPLGDSSLVFTETLEWHSVTYTYLYELVQIGDRVGWTELISSGEPSLAALEELAGAQAACLTDGVCAAPALLPAPYAAKSAESANASPAAGNLGRVPDPDPATLAIPELGLDLTYDQAKWTALPADQLPRDTLALLIQHDGGSVVSLGLDAENATARACVNGYIGNLADDEAFGIARPVGDAQGNAATYGRHVSDQEETFLHVECRALDNEDGFAVVMQTGPLATYSARSADREDLLAGLSPAS